jgi:hypothetical protein
LSKRQVENKQEKIQFPFPKTKPLEMKIADYLFVAFRNNMFLFKILSNPRVHYSVFIIGSTFDFHITMENEADSKKKHVQLLRLQFDWVFFIQKFVQDILANWNSIFQKVKIYDPKWKDLQVEFIPFQVLIEFLSPIQKGNRWNVDANFLNRFETSIQQLTLKELADFGLIIGASPEGYLILSYGEDCWILDQNSLYKNINKNLELSIRKLHVKYYTLGTLALLVRIRLLNFNRIITDYLRKKIIQAPQKVERIKDSPTRANGK